MKNTPADAFFAPEAFPWHENRVQKALQQLAVDEPKMPQQIVEIMNQIEGSHLFWTMNASYTDAIERHKGDAEMANRVFVAMLARFYVAGSLHGNRIESD